MSRPGVSSPQSQSYRELKDEMVLSAVARAMCDQNLGNDGKG